MSSIQRHLIRRAATVRGLPGLLVGGFSVLAVGLVLDLAVHVGGGAHAGSSPGALLVHAVVLAGMGLSLAGLVRAAVASPRSGAGFTRPSDPKEVDR